MSKTTNTFLVGMQVTYTYCTRIPFLRIYMCIHIPKIVACKWFLKFDIVQTVSEKLINNKYKRESYIHVYYINYTVTVQKCRHLLNLLEESAEMINEVSVQIQWSYKKSIHNYSTFDIPSILLFCFPIIPLNFIVTTNDISPMMVYIN